MTALLDQFMPMPDVRERHEITIAAPAPLVMEVAREFDVQSIRLVRAIFWLRAKILGSTGPTRWGSGGLVSETVALGWRCLAADPDRFFVAGAACQPWQADVRFEPVAPEAWTDFADPDRVKIAWTLEAKPLGPEHTRFGTETRVAATGESARLHFRRYWRRFGWGIVFIRLLLLPAVRRQAERAWSRQRTA